MLYLADSKLFSYPTQSFLISDHFAILFDLNLPVIQINQPSRSFLKISSINKPICINFVLHQLNNIISFDLFTLFDYFNLALSHSIDIVHPPLLLSTVIILSFPGVVLSLLTRGIYFVDYNINMQPLHLNLIVFPIKLSIALQKKLLSTKSTYFTDMLGSYGITSKQTYKLSSTLIGKIQTKHFSDQPYSVVFLNYKLFQYKMSSIINVLPNINAQELISI